MAAAGEPKADRFFATRSGVCVYVMFKDRTFRVRFVAADAHGVVEDHGEDAEAARVIAGAALRKHAATLAPLFEKVARSLT